MTSVRHRPLPSSSSSARNPFDSSDEEDESRRSASSSRGSDRDYVNPFDDGEDHVNARAVRPTPTSTPSRSKQPETGAYAKHPFDDDHDDGNAGAQQKRGPTLKAKLDQGTLFDEEPRAHDDLSVQERKSRIKATAAPALKRVQKFKESGAAQASKMVEGGLHQAQRLKESSISAFKSNEGKATPAPSGNEQKQVFGADARRAAFDSGVYDKGQELSDEGHRLDNGLYETGFLGMPSRAKPRYDDHQFQGADLEQRSVQELEGYALQKSEDTTKRIQNCLKVAEDIKGEATHTLVSLHQQGEQMRRAHEVAYDIDQNLAAGEKLLGSLGGMFSRTWKPKKGPAITGPVNDPSDYEIRRKGHHLEQRTALGLDAKRHTDRSSHSTPDFQLQTTQAKLEREKENQDDALADLSNVLDQLKEMSINMGSEIARQNVSLEQFQNDVTTLDERLKGANVRGRQLLQK